MDPISNFVCEDEPHTASRRSVPVLPCRPLPTQQQQHTTRTKSFPRSRCPRLALHDTQYRRAMPSDARHARGGQEYTRRARSRSRSFLALACCRQALLLTAPHCQAPLPDATGQVHSCWPSSRCFSHLAHTLRAAAPSRSMIGPRDHGLIAIDAAPDQVSSLRRLFVDRCALLV